MIATEYEAEREFAYNVGMDNPNRPWILSDRDVWYRNPFYSGPPVRHPDDESHYDSNEEVQVIPEDDIPF